MSDRIEEISEDLEADFGKPYNVSEDNSRYMLSLIEENMIDGVINPDLQEPSLDAMATTTMAIYKYPNIPWRELSQKPAIKRGQTFIACNVSDHPEKVEDMFHRLMQKHYGGLTVKMCHAVLKIVKLMSKDMQPFTSLHEYILIADRYENIIVGLHNLIRPSGKQLDPSLTLSKLCEKLGNPVAIVHQQIHDMYEDLREDWYDSHNGFEVQRIDDCRSSFSSKSIRAQLWILTAPTASFIRPSFGANRDRRTITR